MHYARVSILGVAFGTAVAACGGATTDESSIGNVTGAFTVETDAPSSATPVGASYTLKGGFTSASPACASQRVGACEINPCPVTALIDDGEALVQAGPVTIFGGAMSASSLAPRSDNVYAPDVVASHVPWTTGGEPMTIAWAHVPGDTSRSGGEFTLATPPYVTLAAGAPFADAAPSKLSRDQDLRLSWTNESPPTARDQVNVDLRSGSTEVICTFDAVAAHGVVPAAALQSLAAGAGSFDVRSKEHAAQSLPTSNGSAWTLQFDVDARARTAYGVAKGDVTFE